MCLGGAGWFVRWCSGWSGSWMSVWYCFSCSCKCVLMGRTLVSSCRCCVFVSVVLPVAMRNAVFWMVCSLFDCVSVMIGDQMVLAYSRMGRVMALYVFVMVSLDLPHVVDVSDLRMLIVFWLCWLYFVCECCM